MQELTPDKYAASPVWGSPSAGGIPSLVASGPQIGNFMLISAQLCQLPQKRVVINEEKLIISLQF